MSYWKGCTKQNKNSKMLMWKYFNISAISVNLIKTLIKLNVFFD